MNIIALLAFLPLASLATCDLPADIVAPTATVYCVSRDFSFTEGPTADAQGRVLFTDQNNNNVWLWDETTPKKVTLWATGLGRANGMCFNNDDGTLWACADEKMELWQLVPALKKDGILTRLGEYNGKPFNGPNDVYATKDGIFFTDPFYARKWWSHKTAPQPTAQIYALVKGKAQILTIDMQQPNGIVGDNSGDFLYVSDIKADMTYRYRIVKGPSGGIALACRTIFCRKGSDGMTIDCEGRLYLTGKEGVYVYNADGFYLGLIPVPENWTANVCFGGEKRNILCITASKGFYTIETNTHGLPHGK